jgi:hypothetical protein
MKNQQSLNEVRKVIRELIKEEYIINDILSEGTFQSIIQKVKDWGRKGMITAAVLTNLMSSPAFSQMSPREQEQVKNVAQTEMVVSKSGPDTENAYQVEQSSGAMSKKELIKLYKQENWTEFGGSLPLKMFLEKFDDNAKFTIVSGIGENSTGANLAATQKLPKGHLNVFKTKFVTKLANDDVKVIILFQQK